jgi:hypothetical protein
MKTNHPLRLYIYKEAVRLFQKNYQDRSNLDVVVVDCPDSYNINGLTGKIQDFNKQSGQFLVSVNTHTATVNIHLWPHNMEPLYQATKLGKKTSTLVEDEEVVSIPNIFSVGESTNSHFSVKFHCKVFEQMRKRFIRPEKTPNGSSFKALQEELYKFTCDTLVQQQHADSGEIEYITQFSNAEAQLTTKYFKMPFSVTDNSLFTSGSGLSFFDLNKNTTLLPTVNWDEVLYKAYAKGETLEFIPQYFSSLRPGEELHNNIIDLCLKW